LNSYRWLQVYDRVQYVYTAAIWRPRCLNEPNGKPKNMKALYRVGPDDTTTPAIALQRRFQITVVEETAKANLDYPARPKDVIKICTYGYSNWTLFSEPSFEGISHCLSHPTEMDCSHNSDIGLPGIGSAIRGCDLSTETIAKMKMDFAS